MMEDLDEFNTKYEKGTKTDVNPAELKKDIQQLLKITQMLNIFLFNNTNLVIVQETGSLNVLIENLKSIRSMIGNEEILNHL